MIHMKIRGRFVMLGRFRARRREIKRFTGWNPNPERIVPDRKGKRFVYARGPNREKLALGYRAGRRVFGEYRRKMRRMLLLSMRAALRSVAQTWNKR